MSHKNALVVGASGVIGHAIVRYLQKQDDWTVVGMTRRRAPSFMSDATWISLDINDLEAIRAQSAALSGITHVFYAAYVPDNDLAQEAKTNGLMFRNLLAGLAASGAPLERIVLFQGGKVYGLHLGPVKTPMRESDPRHMPPNFYYELEDALAAESSKNGWSFSLLRPDVVLGAIPGQPLNLAMVIGAYAAFCHELRVPFRFPGTPAAYRALVQATDSDLLARVSAWAATAPVAAGQAYNVTNGDLFRWENLWPLLGRHLGLEAGPPMSIRLVDHMRDKGKQWAELAQRHGLITSDYQQAIAWSFGDFVFHTEFDVVSDLTKLRQHGCHEILRTEGGLMETLKQLQNARIIPPLTV
jgi:nucleoside-diphosphate-sugar epimerase